MPSDALARPATTTRWPRGTGWLLAFLVVLNAGLVMVWSHRHLHPRATPQLATTGLVPAFTLRDTEGRAVTQLTFLGTYALVYFGYTYCPDICPNELGFEARVLKALGSDAARITPVFISVDPQRDTPRQLREYTALFDHRMVALTGTDEQLKVAIAAFGGMYDRQAGPTGPHGSYQINHTSSIYLLGPLGEVLLLCDSHDSVEATAGAVRTWLQARPPTRAPGPL